METLFRLTLTRPAVAQNPDAPSIALAQQSTFQTQLLQARQDAQPREAMRTVARQFMAGQTFIGDPTKLLDQDKLAAMGEALNALEAQQAVNNAAVVKAIETAFGKTIAKVTANNRLDAPLSALRDSILAIKQVPEAHKLPIESLTRQLRDLELIKKVAADAQFPGTGDLLRRYRRRSLLLPDGIALGSSLSGKDRQKDLERQRAAESDRRKKEAEGKLDRYTRLNTAIGELTRFGPNHFERTAQTPDAAVMVPPQFRVTQLAISELTRHQQAADVTIASRRLLAENPEVSARLATAVAIEPPAAASARFAQERKFMAGKVAFTPPAVPLATFRLKAEVERTVSASTQELLKELNLGLASDPLDRVVETLRTAAVNVSEELDQLLGRPTQRTFKGVGGGMVMIATPMQTVWNKYVTGSNIGGTAIPFIPMQSIPDSHGTITAAGIADLLVVKQQLVRYEGADVAHIENVLKGESKTREHSTRRETEQLTFRESETTTTQERELESTSRFEMSRETSETIKEDASLKAGLTVSGKYGPSVEFAASAEGSVSRSKEEASKAASKFSQDVTERSSNKITERVLERSSLKITDEVIEKNAHILDNVKGTGHISGVYQWVNKVYQAQMFNYGMRTLYDFMVAEPAAFLISALEGSHANAVEIEKPLPFTLRPDQISEWNYGDWVKRYGATDVEPPPEIYRTKSLDFKAGGGDSDADYNHSGQITIDDGYKAIYGTIATVKNTWEDNASIDVALGSRAHRLMNGEWIFATPLDEERDSIPVAIDTWKVSQIAAAVEVKCQRTERAMLKWRLETHGKLTTAYKARLQEYEEKLAALEVQAGVAIHGRNPGINQEMMRDELKKHCISILTDQHFDLFDSIETGGYNVPQLNLSENALEGPYIRFFEQAFEWEQMTWLTYPYFWGRKSQWFERVSYDDVDPDFAAFLKAGSCRVVVPVRPGFEGAIDHFMTYGEPWNGGPLPPISTNLYVPIADEIAERLDRPGDEVTQGDPWLVRIPTSLVHLRADDKLPAWKQDAQGEWVEA